MRASEAVPAFAAEGGTRGSRRGQEERGVARGAPPCRTYRSRCSAWRPKCFRRGLLVDATELEEVATSILRSIELREWQPNALLFAWFPRAPLSEYLPTYLRQGVHSTSTEQGPPTARRWGMASSVDCSRPLYVHRGLSM